MQILRKYPDSAEIHGETYRFEKILKDDFFSVNILYINEQGRRYVLKLSDFRFLFGLLFRPFAMMMSSHEYKIYSRVKDIDGVPELGPRLGLRGYYHEFIEGKTLHEWTRGDALPESFFDELGGILRQVHDRRVFYCDLNKQGNVIVSEQGKPFLIDFQICMHFTKRGGPYGRWSERLFQKLIKEDIYHVYKHKRRFQRDRLTEEEADIATRSKFGKRYNRFFGLPYKRVKRLIYPSGSNEIIWYKWRKIKDKTRRMS